MSTSDADRPTTPLTRTEVHLTVADQSALALDLLSRETGLTRQRIKQTMQKGAVWLTRGKSTKVIRRAKKPLRAADQLHMYYDEAILQQQAPAPALILDQGSYSVWDKPYGVLSRGSRWGDHCTINRLVEASLEPQRPAFIVHRLDRAATGLIILAHSKSAAQYFSRLFAERRIEKHYRATVVGRFAASGERRTLNEPLDGKPAVSHVTVLSYDGDTDSSTLEINIETGRKHQIRRHLSEAGVPVIGDRLYGKPDPWRNLQLRAVSLSFDCPELGSRRTIQLEESQTQAPSPWRVSAPDDPA